MYRFENRFTMSIVMLAIMTLSISLNASSANAPVIDTGQGQAFLNEMPCALMNTNDTQTPNSYATNPDGLAINYYNAHSRVYDDQETTVGQILAENMSAPAELINEKMAVETARKYLMLTENNSINLTNLYTDEIAACALARKPLAFPNIHKEVSVTATCSDCSVKKI